jgi:hypothetical protein
MLPAEEKSCIDYISVIFVLPMTAEIVAINSDVTRQKALLDSFQAAVAVLDPEAVQEILEADRYHQFDVIYGLATDIAAQVDSHEDLKDQFRDAAILALNAMMPNFNVIDRDNHKEVKETIEYAQFDILARYAKIAVDQELLPPMFWPGRQHADRVMCLTN